jgi:tRNA pseudouridine13 synthase
MNPRDFPYLTSATGTLGELKQTPEDFVVEEVPLYEPSGEGPHVFLYVEKRDLSTPFLVTKIADALSINPNEIGSAGRKDRFAVTRQFVSIPDQNYEDQQLLDLEIDGARVLSCKRHPNKLKTGHLKGNRFEIVVRNATENALANALATKKELEQLGFANWYGEQRFGNQDDTDDLGFRLLRDEKLGRLSKNKLRFALSAAQSRMFNDWLADRIEDGLNDRVIDGDVMQFQTSRATFVAEDLEAEQARFDAGEIVPTGPMFGPKMTSAESTAVEREAAILERFGLDIEAFSRYRKLTTGTRRRMLIKPQDFSVEPTEGGLRFRFELPSGVYATTLLAEFMKTDL